MASLVAASPRYAGNDVSVLEPGNSLIINTNTFSILLETKKELY